METLQITGEGLQNKEAYAERLRLRTIFIVHLFI
jgi:hypothetical protein